MVKIILGQFNGGLSKVLDSAIITGENGDGAVAKSIIRMLGTNSHRLSDSLLPSQLTESHLTTSTDLSCLKEFLRESNLTLFVVDVMHEAGDEETSGAHIYITNKNVGSMVKPALIYHSDATEIDEVAILNDVKDKFSLFPESIYANSRFNTSMESELELKKLGLTKSDFNVTSIKNSLNRMGFDYDVVLS